MYKSIFKWLLVILWMVVIFCFSNQKSYESDNSSHSVIRTIVKFTNKVHLTNYSVNDIDSIYNSLNRPIRKLAHFSEYFILALLLFNAMGFSNKNILSFWHEFKFNFSNVSTPLKKSILVILLFERFNTFRD